MCALDASPSLSLFWERYVMTRNFSLLLTCWFSIGLSLIYGIGGCGNLRCVQALSVLLIGFRMSFLPVVRLARFCCHSLPLHVVVFRRYAADQGRAHRKQAC